MTYGREPGPGRKCCFRWFSGVWERYANDTHETKFRGARVTYGREFWPGRRCCFRLFPGVWEQYASDTYKTASRGARATYVCTGSTCALNLHPGGGDTGGGLGHGPMLPGVRPPNAAVAGAREGDPNQLITQYTAWAGAQGLYASAGTADQPGRARRGWRREARRRRDLEHGARVGQPGPVDVADDVGAATST